MGFKQIKAISITQKRDPDLIRRMNLLGESDGLMTATAFRRFLDKTLPRTKKEAEELCRKD